MRALDSAGLAPNRLVLEITESHLMTHTEGAVRTLETLASMGVQIAMDDFGTGYSSLAYLWRFPFDKVKIDRAFTQGLGGDDRVALIVRSIITLAHSMGIRVNAKGAETTPAVPTRPRSARRSQRSSDKREGGLGARVVTTTRVAPTEGAAAP